MSEGVKTNVNNLLEGAYLAGFEPSADNLTESQIINEAINFLTLVNLQS